MPRAFAPGESSGSLIHGGAREGGAAEAGKEARLAAASAARVNGCVKMLIFCVFGVSS